MEFVNELSGEQTSRTLPARLRTLLPREDAEDAVSDNGIPQSVWKKNHSAILKKTKADESAYDDQNWFRAAEKGWPSEPDNYAGTDVEGEMEECGDEEGEIEECDNEDNSDEGSPAASLHRAIVYDDEENGIHSGFTGLTAAELQRGSARNQLRGVQIRKYESEVRFYTSEVAEIDVPSFLASSGQETSQWALNMQDTPIPKKHDSNHLSTSSYIKGQLQTSWAIHETCFDAHERLWSGVLTYMPVDGDASWKGYLIRTDRSWSWACTLAISHSTSSKTTYGVCIGLKPREAEILVRLLERGKRNAGNPLFVPIALVERYMRTTIAMNRRHNMDFYNIQTAMKTDYYIISPKVQRDLDLVEFASRLTALGSSSVGVTQLCSTQHRIMQFLDDQLKMLKKEKAPGTDVVLNALCEHLAFAKQLLQAERQHNEYIKAATQAQVQMVYSLTAQRDNEHSLNLARLSQEQNKINIQISKFAAYESRLSNKMAKESLRYGVDMQIIAAVTLGFLPGTFMATLFSASFWDFQPDNQGRVVSSWVWLYWVLTVVLTVGVLAAWRIMSRVKADGLEPPPESLVLKNVDDSEEIA